MTLKVENLSLTLGKRTLVSELGFTAKAGSVLALMGPSGCGKSSVLDAICGTLSPAFSLSGSIKLNDLEISDLPPYKRKIGLQVQDHLLFPHLSVVENLMFGIPAHYSKAERIIKAEKALVDCQLAEFGQHNPATLSGGQRARISLMRTLLSEPEALLLDEPFSKLDPDLRVQFRSFVFQQITELVIPVVMVTHDQADIPLSAETLLLTAS